jgi:hypothetical protein
MALTVMGLSVNDILSLKKRGIGADGFVSEIYSAAAGEAGLVDTANTTAVYVAAQDTYGQGVVQTNKLYHSATAITTLKVNDLRKGKVATGGTVDISFDDGSSWSTATNQLNTDITSFTGTASDGGTYKLKLKFTLGASYLESGAYAWVTTSSLNVARGLLAGCGTTTDALAWGGYSGSSYLSSTEKWSGSSWATTTSLTNAIRGCGGCGTTAAALSFGGYSSVGPEVNKTEIWSGASWATTGVLTEEKYYIGGCGTTAAALAIGGSSDVTYVDTTEKWTGSWATTTDLTGIKSDSGVCGTTAAALCFGGDTGAIIDVTEIWLVSSWATTTVLIEAKRAIRGCGTTAAALCCGGYSGSSYLSSTEKWNGSIWVTTTDLLGSIRQSGNCGTVTNSLFFGGNPQTATTERWLNSGLQKGFAAKIN